MKLVSVALVDRGHPHDGAIRKRGHVARGVAARYGKVRLSGGRVSD